MCMASLKSAMKLVDDSILVHCVLGGHQKQYDAASELGAAQVNQVKLSSKKIIFSAISPSIYDIKAVPVPAWPRQCRVARLV